MIIFVAPGLGKSFLVKQQPELFIDCDTIIEQQTGRKVSEISWTADWSAAKANIMIWYKQYYSHLHLLVGKNSLIKDADFAILHRTPSVMQAKISSNNRENPIYNWNCRAKLSEYYMLAKKHNKLVKATNGYVSDLIHSFIPF